MRCLTRGRSCFWWETHTIHMLKINGKDNLGREKCFEENNQGEVLANYLVMMVI